MKIRNGFVSNSSSSSYIIAFNGMDRSDLEKLFIPEYHSGDNTSIDAIGIKDIIENIKPWYELDYYPEDTTDAEYYYEQFIRFASIASKIAKAVENGDNIALVCISYGDEVSYDNLNNDSIRIVESFD